MNFLNLKLKLKYKLLIINLLPFFVLLLFVFHMIQDDISNYQNAKIDQQLIETFSLGTRISSNIFNEQSLSANYLEDEISTESITTQLKVARDNTIQEVEQFKKIVSEISSEGDYNQLLNVLTPLLNNLENLKDFRYQVERNAVNQQEADEFYDQMHYKLIDGMVKIANEIHQKQYFNSIYNLLFLLNEKVAAINEKHLLGENANLEKFSFEKFSILNKVIGEQAAYRNAYFILGSNKEDKLLSEMTQSINFHKAERIRDDFIKSPSTKIELKNWRDIQSEKIASLNTIVEKINGELVEKAEQVKSTSFNHIVILISVIFTSLLIAFSLMFFSLKKITKRLENEVKILSNTGNTIISSLAEASAGTAETATNVAETTSTVEELKQTAEIASQSSNNIAELSKNNLSTLLKVESNLKQNMDGMNRIKDGMQTISQTIVQLSEQTLTIRNIIDSVDDLAEQSHLLAINAAIEAAKAKEHGKGFSVVAQEIRNLAEQSKQATIQVRSILNDIKNSTNSAVMATEQGTKAVNFGMEFSQTINETIKTLSENIVNAANATNQISQNSEQQLIGVNQVTLSMINIKDASSQHVIQIGEIENALQGINEASSNLRSLINELKV